MTVTMMPSAAPAVGILPRAQSTGASEETRTLGSLAGRSVRQIVNIGSVLAATRKGIDCLLTAVSSIYLLAQVHFGTVGAVAESISSQAKSAAGFMKALNFVDCVDWWLSGQASLKKLALLAQQTFLTIASACDTLSFLGKSGILDLAQASSFIGQLPLGAHLVNIGLTGLKNSCALIGMGCMIIDTVQALRAEGSTVEKREKLIFAFAGAAINIGLILFQGSAMTYAFGALLLLKAVVGAWKIIHKHNAEIAAKRAAEEQAAAVVAPAPTGVAAA